jgi:hypothetical protein
VHIVLVPNRSPSLDVQSRLQALRSAQRAKVNAQNALAAARDAAVAAEWEFHNMILGVKDQVIAQYGKDSDQVQSKLVRPLRNE